MNFFRLENNMEPYIIRSTSDCLTIISQQMKKDYFSTSAKSFEGVEFRTWQYEWGINCGNRREFTIFLSLFKFICLMMNGYVYIDGDVGSISLRLIVPKISSYSFNEIIRYYNRKNHQLRYSKRRLISPNTISSIWIQTGENDFECNYNNICINLSLLQSLPNCSNVFVKVKKEGNEGNEVNEVNEVNDRNWMSIIRMYLKSFCNEIYGIYNENEKVITLHYPNSPTPLDDIIVNGLLNIPISLPTIGFETEEM